MLLKSTCPEPEAPSIRPAEDPAFVRALFSRIAARYDLANSILSGGLDWFWRRRAAAQVRDWEPERLLDLATGSGALLETIQAACPGIWAVGADFCPPMLGQARARRGLPRLVAADGLRLPFADRSFDALTVAFGLRNMASWSGAVQEMARVLRPGGHLLVLDFSLPRRTLLRAAYRLYLHRGLPLVAALVCGERRAYDYLGASIESFPRGDAMSALLEQGGFRAPTAEALTGGIVSLYTAERTGVRRV
jgi:demethylmenaquinone methyltransferase/2-methoxy-6-polyprenyl-1,4-benzoquinol methylase